MEGIAERGRAGDRLRSGGVVIFGAVEPGEGGA